MADQPKSNPLAILEGQLSQQAQALRSQITTPELTACRSIRRGISSGLTV